MNATPESPDASRNTQSFVEHSPSTVMALKLSSTTRLSAPPRTSGDTRASVVRKPSIVAMRGSIMPDPFAMPPTRKVPAAVSTLTACDLGNGSVVMIARVAASAPATESSRAAASMPARTFAGSSWTPITPVDATSTCSGRHPRASAAAAAMSRATVIPAAPVHALAHPLFTTIACASPPLSARCARAISIGAATALLVVNMPAAGTGVAAATSATSSAAAPPAAGCRLMPHATPAALNPAGAVTPP